MAETVVELRGTPAVVDTFLAPLARLAALVVGAVGSAILWWLGMLWYVPLPFAGLLLLNEAWLHTRGDRAQRLRLAGSRLTLSDPLGEADRVVELGTITNATLYHRDARELLGVVTRSVDLVVGDDEGVRFALHLDVVGAFEPRIEHVPVEPIDRIFGGIAGIFRALAPSVARPRQAFVDAEGRMVRALIDAVPADAWRRTGLRLWTGMEPPVDLFGYYEGGHDGWLVLDGHRWTARIGGEQLQGEVEGWGLVRSERSAVLFQGLEDRQTVERVALGLIDLGVALTVAVPMPLFVAPDETQPLTGDLRHTHAPEGAGLLWHLLLHTPRDRWPATMKQQIEVVEQGSEWAARLPGS